MYEKWQNMIGARSVAGSRRVLLSVLMCIAGCAAPGGPSAPTQADRLMKAYSELEAGRFFVLADFEGENAAQLVELVNASGKANTKIDRKRGRPETGGAALEFRLASDADTIVLASTDNGGGYFKRDWRPYDELMISVFSPVEGARLHLGLAAGRAGELHSVFTQIPLAKGWNTARVDLAELEGQAALDDMRELRLSIAGARKAVAVRIDDVLLTRSRTDLLGDSANTSGGFYVQRVSNHWNIGAGGRFELSFLNGQVTRWYNLASDPHRIRNLLEGTTLGPTAVTVNTATGEHQPLIKHAQIRVGQRLLELSPVRAVVAVDCFLGGPEEGDKASPAFSSEYVIYPTGQIYIRASVAPSLVQGTQFPVGLLVSVASAGASDFQVQTPSVSSPSSISTYFAVRHGPGNAVLGFIPAWRGSTLHAYDAETRQLALIAVDEKQGATQWAAHLFLASAEADWEQELAHRATDYISPPPFEFLIGGRGERAESSMRPFAFDQGCYQIVPDSGRLRLRLSGRAHPMFSPAFCVEGSAGRRGWVYLKNLIHQPMGTTAEGDLVFQLPGIVRENQLVEVVLEASPRALPP